MDYRVPATAPMPPSRKVAWIGGMGALGLLVSPWLVWWAYEWIPATTLAPTLTARYPGHSHAFGRLLIFFGLISLAFWVQYARDPARWMRPIGAGLVIYALLAGSLLAVAVTGDIVLTRGGLPGMYAQAQIGPGLAMAVSASLVHSACLSWLVYERLVRAGRRNSSW